MGHSRVLFLGTLLAARTTFLVAADPTMEDAKPKPKTEPGATVVVTAEARPVASLDTPNPVKVADAERIQQSGARGAAELMLDLLPGQVAANGGLGTSASLFLGGARSQDTIVLLDGLRITEVGGVNADLSLIGLTGIDRVEVLMGPASTLFGADAHGGVVALSSPGAPQTGFSGELGGALGTTSLRTGRSRNAYGWGSGWVRAELAATSQDQPTATDRPYRANGIYLGLGQNLGEDTLLTIHHRETYQATPIPWNWDFANQRTYTPEREASFRQESTSLGLHGELGHALRSDLALGRVELHRDSRFDPYPYHPTSRRDQVLETLSLVQPRWQASLLLDGSAERQWTTDLAAQAQAHHGAVALEASGEPAEGLRLVGSLRRQRDRLLQEGGGSPESTLWQSTWKAGLNFRKGSWRAYASTGTSFNTPSLYALGANLANGKPQPGNEESRSTVAGLGWSTGPWTLRVDANRIQYDRLLNFVPLGGWNGYYENRNQVRVQGAELTAAWQGQGTQVEAFARSQEGRDFTLPKDRQLTFFQNRPFFTGGLRGATTLGDLTLSGRFAFIGHRYVYSSDAGGTAAEHTHFVDLAFQASYRLRKDLDLVLRADHLLQDPLSRADWEQQRDVGRNNVALVPGYPAPTRSLTFEARYRF